MYRKVGSLKGEVSGLGFGVCSWEFGVVLSQGSSIYLTFVVSLTFTFLSLLGMV